MNEQGSFHCLAFLVILLLFYNNTFTIINKNLPGSWINLCYCIPLNILCLIVHSSITSMAHTNFDEGLVTLYPIFIRHISPLKYRYIEKQKPCAKASKFRPSGTSRKDENLRPMPPIQLRNHLLSRNRNHRPRSEDGRGPVLIQVETFARWHFQQFIVIRKNFPEKRTEKSGL
uniref:Uncharacterized protein n=1 Tax=Candidatus Kentrum sp. LPFa TaxID=2126335 RepID=A0A450WTT6_9GAMM|nr:MAG: hypothetical protein BECKLPF1236B_GA0070989_121213 [Candidatus Kentron sp. LPFa]